MMFRGMRCAILGAALAVAAPAAAQEQPASGEDAPEIVIEGKRTIDREIHDFVGAIAQNPAHRQLSRFERSVCPTAAGLAPEQARAVVERLRQVAKAANLRVGEAGCMANIVVAVTPDKSAFLKALRTRYPDYFANLSGLEIRRLIATKGPAVAWQLAGPPLSARGTEVMVDPNTGFYTNKTTEPPTRGTAPTRPQFEAAVVVVESGALEGLTTTQLADYAAMRAYAGTNPARLGAAPPPTILTVLDTPMGAAAPAGLTRWDLGFLRGLYTAPVNAYAGAQRSAMRKTVAGELDREPAQ